MAYRVFIYNTKGARLLGTFATVADYSKALYRYKKKYPKWNNSFTVQQITEN